MSSEQQLLAFAAKLGVSVEHLWSTIVQQAHYSAIMNVLSLIFFIGMLAYWLLSLRFQLDKTRMEKDTKEIVLLSVTVILVAINVIVIPISFSQAFTAYTNPEFWALDYILSTIVQ